ncbi:hypothetical protein [Pantoea ananatis]|nr:hypothetical protein [Pantoea ananatis]PWK05861.1 hypothetical protein C7421_112142 [Pantoea ananatis]
MYEEKNKAIREADERERASNWLIRLNFKGIMLMLEVFAIGIILYSLWRN